MDRIYKNYLNNVHKIEKELLNCGINIRKTEDEIKSFQEVIQELSERWGTLSKEENRIQKAYVCEQIAGTRNRNYLIMLVDNLTKSK